jgi:hypothetical protein
MHAAQKGAGAVVKVAVGGMVGAFLVFYILTSPDQAANIVHHSWALVVKVAHGIGGFVDKLAS